MAAMKIHGDGVPFKLCIHFAKNPGAAMFVEDIAEKWGVHPKLVWARLKSAKEAGLVESRKTGRETYYVAGKALLEIMHDA